MAFKYAPPEVTFFADDILRQNWCWLLYGPDASVHMINAVANRELSPSQIAMANMEPAEAVRHLERAFGAEMKDEVRERGVDAQVRLFPPLIVSREGNVIRLNFRRKVA